MARYLKARGRTATGVAELGLRGSTDPALLRELSKRPGLGEWVLVTGNDGMPNEHPLTFARLRPTVATVEPEKPCDVTELAWRMDVVHRWAHAMQGQDRGSVRRYSLAGSRLWTPRRRRGRLA